MFKNLRKTFSTLFGLQLIFIILLTVLIFSLYINQKNLSHSRDTNYESYQLADQLRQSSDDLTRMARTYVVTGNPEFEREYQAVLDIRNGKIPRPLDYDNIYWDFVAVNGEKPRGDDKAISLQNLMKQEGFTEAEFAKLNLAQKNSDNLGKTEMIAMNAMKGLFQDSEGNFTIKKAPDQEMAIRIMHDENYYKMKAEVMRPIDDFYLMFEERTAGAVNRYLSLANIFYEAVIIVAIILLILAIYSFIIIGRQIILREQSENKISELNKNLEKLAEEKAQAYNNLEQRIKERTEKLEQSEANIAKTLNEAERMNRLMVGRELEMINLKKQIIDLKNNNK